MKNLHNILIGLAFVVGASIAVPLYMYVSNSLFHKGNDAKSVIPLYIKNSEELEVKVPNYDPFKPNNSLFVFRVTYLINTYISIKIKYMNNIFRGENILAFIK
ncbi:hypothetical protein ABIB40_004023, partial [Pedobacter sp. UYP30]|uniref:hypothetical protein n=1 Tax=Pedobacter sp. UYP30 TaxID=1756400 RepID=UPI0033926155